MTDLWEDLVATALVGTERRAPALVPADDRLGSLLAQLDPADRERALLSAAALAAQHRRAGRRPEHSAQPLPEPCPPDERPTCGPAASARLRGMLQGQQRDLLPEWLAVMAAASQRAPAASLPGLLELGRQQPDLMDAILPVLGERGRWLAAQNPDWAWAAGGDDDMATWQTGSREARLVLLRRLREADPEQGRDLLAATWTQEAPADRARFLAAFEVGLSLADEPMLEAALDDRRKEVRNVAADLLARLPESRLVQRMIARVEPLLAFTPAQPSQIFPPRRSRPAQLSVTLPGECDAAMQRDGIKPTTADTRLGERAWWLRQMLSLIPPVHWCERWQTTPAELLAVTEQHKWQAVLGQGWSAAAARHQDAAWLEALVEREPVRAGLLTLLPPARREAIISRRLAADRCPLCRHDPLLQMFIESRGAWSVPISRTIIQTFRQHIAAAHKDQGTILHTWLTACGYSIPPSLAAELGAGWPEDAEHWQAWKLPVGTFRHLLHDRATMLKEIAP